MAEIAVTSATNRFADRWLSVGVVLVTAQTLAHVRYFRTDGLVGMLTPSPGLPLLLTEAGVLVLCAAALASVRRRWLAWPLAGGLATFVIGGWLSYVLTGGFPNLDSIALFLQSPQQVLSHSMHFDPSALPLAAAAWVVLTLALVLAHYRPMRLGGWSGFSMTLTLLLCAQVALRDGRRLDRSHRVAFDSTSGVTRPYDQLWQELRSRGGGAISSLGRSLLDRALGRADTFPALDPAIVLRLPPISPGSAQHGAPVHRWNVLIVVVESLREDEVFDPRRVTPTMPNLEAISRGSLRFTNAYATATQTNLATVVPVSGQYPLRTTGAAAYPSPVPYPRTLVYEMLHAAGWRTGVFSSQNEHWWGMHRFLASNQLDTLFDANAAPNRAYVTEDDVGFAKFVAEGKASGKLYDHVTIDAAVEWMGRERATPFFVLLNLQASHLPYSTPPGTPRLFGKAQHFPIRFGTWPRDSTAAVRDEYRNALAFIDVQLGRLRDALRASGQWDSTVIVITGDHGQAFYEHDVAAHANGLWEELVRVPLIVRWPGVRVGTDSILASHIDIPPTIAGVLGFDANDAWPGIRLDAPVGEPMRPVFLLVQSPLAHQTGVIFDGFKLVRDLETRALRLHDLVCDPGEKEDILANQPTAAAALSALLRTWERSQLSYYRSSFRMRSELPPRVEGLRERAFTSRLHALRCASADTSARSGTTATEP